MTLQCLSFAPKFLQYIHNRTHKIVVLRFLCQRSEKKGNSDNKLSRNKIFDKKFLSHIRKLGYLYIKEEKDADSIAEYLCKDFNEGYLLEANSGPGVLTKALLNKGVSHLRVFEKNEEFLTSLNELSIEYPNLEVIHDDIMLFPSFEARLSLRESSSFDSFFCDIPEFTWGKGTPFRFFSVINGRRSIKFLRYLLAGLMNKGLFFSFGQCEFFLLVPDSEYTYMIAEPKGNLTTYRWITVLYRLFFDIECLEKFSSEILHPLVLRGRKAVKKREFYLVKLRPSSDLFSGVVNGNKLPDFYFFVRHHLIKRTGYVIPTLEGWIPSCGPRLIKEGMHVFTQFGDLSPKQILVLFNQFSSWPEYEDSSFTAAMQRYYGKCPLSYDDDDIAEVP